jgi:hypothetical protein
MSKDEDRDSKRPRPLPKDWRSLPTITLPQCAEALDVGRSAAYKAAAAGDIPVIQLGGMRRVPVAWVIRKLEGAA